VIRIEVDLAARSYPIFIGSGLLRDTALLGRAIKSKQVMLVTNELVDPLYAHFVEEALQDRQLRKVSLRDGESQKTIESYYQILTALLEAKFERGCTVVALGGGVVGDMAGFAAAVFMRGIRLVQVPTTLLSQVDSSVGGKVGVNLKAGKNLVGAFHQPRLVLCDLDTLTTLPDRELRSGIAEIVKYGVIYDATLFQRLEKQLDGLLEKQPPILSAIIARCCAIKAEIVSQDETETGMRAALNFGHTIGHAIENSSGYGKFLHGEAISIGQVAAAHLSARRTGLPTADVQRIQALFERLGLPTSIKLPGDKRDKLFSAMRLDKKVSAGEIHFVLAEQIGKAVWGQRVPDAEVNWALDQVKG
jgi:3-dehydroquinate synthase